MRPHAACLGLGLVTLALTAGAGAGGSVVAVQPRTGAAYESYLRNAEAAFLARVRGERPPRTPTADDSAGIPDDGPQGRIVRVPGGLVHHWRGAIHIPGADLPRVLAVAQDYGSYHQVYPRVIEARLLHREGDRFVIVTRIKESAGIVSAVLQLRSVVSYRRFATQAYSLSTTEEIREVFHSGLPDERPLPPGRGSGYLWRANTFTRFVTREDGVDVELEAIGLSRRFPPLLGWLIEPIAYRLGRSSVERTLCEFSRAVRGVVPSPGPTP
jgi:hypothetical protein